MATKWIRSILAAVDLGDTTPNVLRTAEALTEATEARLPGCVGELAVE